jgi:hypothetical protein
VASPTTLLNDSTLARSEGGGGSLHLLVIGPKVRTIRPEASLQGRATPALSVPQRQ